MGATHRRANAACLGLVAGREYYPGSHDDGATQETRVISLLDRGIERVEVGVEDRGLGQHEHMFASCREGAAFDCAAAPRVKRTRTVPLLLA